MKRSMIEVQERLLEILKRNSRIPIQDAAFEMGTSRITAKKALDYLVESGRIVDFTVTLREDLENIALIHVENYQVKEDDPVLEYFSLIDGSFILVVYYEDLLKLESLQIKDVKIARERFRGKNPLRVKEIHCDYCGSKIINTPQILTYKNRTYYMCCPTCKAAMEKRLVLESRER